MRLRHGVGQQRQRESRSRSGCGRDMRAKDWVLLGNYHSHPASPARPSDEDIRLAFDPAASYLIISLIDREQPELRGFRIQKGIVEEESIVILEDEIHG